MDDDEDYSSLWQTIWNQNKGDIVEDFNYMIEEHKKKLENIDFSRFRIDDDEDSDKEKEDDAGKIFLVPSLLSVCFEQVYKKEQLLYQIENPKRKKWHYRLSSSIRLLLCIPPSDKNKLNIENPKSLFSKDPTLPLDLRRDYVLHRRCKELPMNDTNALIKMTLMLIRFNDNSIVFSPSCFDYWAYYWIFLGPCSVDFKVGYRKLFLEYFYIISNIEKDDVTDFANQLDWFHPFKFSVEPLLKVLTETIMQFQKCALIYFDETEMFCRHTCIETVNGKNVYPTKPEEIVWRNKQRLPWATKGVKRALVEAKECLFKTTNYSVETLQPIWVCLTCNLGTCTNHCICHNCALRCHKDHRLVYLGVHESWCDCYECTC